MSGCRAWPAGCRESPASTDHPLGMSTDTMGGGEAAGSSAWRAGEVALGVPFVRSFKGSTIRRPTRWRRGTESQAGGNAFRAAVRYAMVPRAAAREALP